MNWFSFCQPKRSANTIEALEKKYSEIDIDIIYINHYLFTVNNNILWSCCLLYILLFRRFHYYNTFSLNVYLQIILFCVRDFLRMNFFPGFSSTIVTYGTDGINNISINEFNIQWNWNFFNEIKRDFLWQANVNMRSYIHLFMHFYSMNAFFSQSKRARQLLLCLEQ